MSSNLPVEHSKTSSHFRTAYGFFGAFSNTNLISTFPFAIPVTCSFASKDVPFLDLNPEIFADGTDWYPPEPFFLMPFAKDSSCLSVNFLPLISRQIVNLHPSW